MDKKDNETRYWLDKQLKLFGLKFALIELLIVVLLLVFWETISKKLGIYDSPWLETICFLFIAGILTTINIYFHSRKGCELEMKDNIAAIRECAEQSLEYYRAILSILNNANRGLSGVEKNDITDVAETMSKQKSHTTKMLQYNVYEEDDRKNSENEDEMLNHKQTLPAVIETPLQSAQYNAFSDDPINFDPIGYLAEQNANTDILENFSAKRIIIEYYMQCAERITQYEDYSVIRSESMHETAKIAGRTVDIAIQISTTNGVSYLITIAFTVKEE